MAEAKLSTWLMIMFFFLTDLWLLSISIVGVAELTFSDNDTGDQQPFIDPLAWGIALPVISFFFLTIWIVVFLHGYFSREQRRRQHSKDVTNTSFSDHKIWSRIGILTYFLFFILSSLALILYNARFSSCSTRLLSDFGDPLLPSARVWTISAVLFPSIASFMSLIFQTVSTWKYWALVWSCSDQSLFKNPFYPEKNVHFHMIK